LEYLEAKPSSEPNKPAATTGKPESIRPDKRKKGRFKDKEEYFVWAEKRKNKLRRRAAVKAAFKEKFLSFIRGKSYLEKKFIISSASVVLAALAFFLFCAKSAKVESWTPGRMPALEQMETPLSSLGSETGKNATPAGGKKAYNIDDLLPRARKIMVLVKTPGERVGIPPSPPGVRGHVCTPSGGAMKLKFT
jgi:hypothetical protein